MSLAFAKNDSASVQQTSPILSGRIEAEQILQTKMIQDSSDLTKKQNALEFSYKNLSYLQSSDDVSANEQVFQLHDIYNLKNSQHSVRAELLLGGYKGKNFVFGAVPEVYYQYTTNLNALTKNIQINTITLGRKVINISEADQAFNLGLVNPYFTQDFLSFQKQGLVGLHYDLNTKNWGGGLSALPIYLPNQGPSVQEKYGKIEGSNRWVKKPPAQFAFNDNNKEIVYSINYTEVSKLVFSPGAIAYARLGQVDNQVHFVASYSRRPMNEPVLERETYADLNVVGNVNLVPQVLYDDLYTADLRFKNESVKTSLSYISDRPQNKIARDFYSIQTLKPLNGMTASVDYSLETKSKNKYNFGLALGAFSGGEIIDLNSDGTENIFTFSKQRLQYKMPTQVSFGSDLLSFGSKTLYSNFKWLYDREQKGSVFTTEFNLNNESQKGLAAHLGFDILGTEEQKTDDIGFIQQFQANDRVYGGLDYVF